MHTEPILAWGGGEMVDAGDLKSPGATHEGSIPSRPTPTLEANSEANLNNQLKNTFRGLDILPIFRNIP